MSPDFEMRKRRLVLRKENGPVTRSDVVSGPFEVQGRVRRSDMRVCLLAVTGHWLHLSLEAFEKGRGGRYGDITRLFEMFCQNQKKKRL